MGAQASPGVSPHHCHRGNHTLCRRIKHRAAAHGHLCTLWDVLSPAAPALPPEPYPSAAALRGGGENSLNPVPLEEWH